MLAYTVACEFVDAQIAQRWVEWLREEHLRDVCAAGAVSAAVIWLDGAPAGEARCEVRYLFSSRQSFERYERDHAPRLREEGLKRFPLNLGLSYTRSSGEVIATCSA